MKTKVLLWTLLFLVVGLLVFSLVINLQDSSVDECEYQESAGYGKSTYQATPTKTITETYTILKRCAE